jgi:hypothetical protein
MVRPPGFVMRESDFEYRFLHDRIQQAAYLLVPKEHNKQQHLDVAHFLLTKAEKPGAEHTVVTAAASLLTLLLLLLLHDSSSHLRLGWGVQQRFDVFDIAYHFNKASGLITEPEQRLLVARLNLRAAIKAKKSMGTLLFTVSCIVSYRTLSYLLSTRSIRHGTTGHSARHCYASRRLLGLGARPRIPTAHGCASVLFRGRTGSYATLSVNNNVRITQNGPRASICASKLMWLTKSSRSS